MYIAGCRWLSLFGFLFCGITKMCIFFFLCFSLMSFVYNIHVNSLVCWVSALWTFQLIHPTSLDFVWRPPAQGGRVHLCSLCYPPCSLPDPKKKWKGGSHYYIFNEDIFKWTWKCSQNGCLYVCIPSMPYNAIWSYYVIAMTAKSLLPEKVIQKGVCSCRITVWVCVCSEAGPWLHNWRYHVS
jgi:hypothetical protein